MLEAGWFLHEFIKALNIKKKIFADYIHTKESNLSALFSGKRRINADLAVKFGKIFGVKPVIWINIQSKNDIYKIESQRGNEYQTYSLSNLLEKAK